MIWIDRIVRAIAIACATRRHSGNEAIELAARYSEYIYIGCDGKKK